MIQCVTVHLIFNRWSDDWVSDPTDPPKKPDQRLLNRYRVCSELFASVVALRRNLARRDLNRHCSVTPLDTLLFEWP